MYFMKIQQKLNAPAREKLNFYFRKIVSSNTVFDFAIAVELKNVVFYAINTLYCIK